MIKLAALLAALAVGGCVAVVESPRVYTQAPTYYAAPPLTYVVPPQRRAHTQTCWRQSNGIVCTKHY